MSVNLYTFVDLYSRLLRTLEHIVAKGAEHAVSKGASAEQILDWRLVDDMNPLRFQLMVVCNFTRQWTARAANLPVPGDISTDLSLAQFRGEIAGSLDFLKTLKPEQFAGRDGAALTVKLGNGMEPTLPVAQWITVFATTNIYFHTSAAYAILRAKGVPLGKADLFSTGL